MENCEHDVISRGESGMTPEVSIFSVAEHLIFSLQCSNKRKAQHIFSSHKNNSFICSLTTYDLNFKTIPLFLAWFFTVLQISGSQGLIVELKSAVRPCKLKITGANAIETASLFPFFLSLALLLPVRSRTVRAHCCYTVWLPFSCFVFFFPFRGLTSWYLPTFWK